MNIFGRKIRISSILNKLRVLPKMILNSLKFESPLSLWKAYVTENYDFNKIKLRNGLAINLSDNKADIITLMVIFCKKESGEILPNCIIIDIGANIGAFSIYAAMAGANKIYSFEPNKSSYIKLVQNVRINRLTEIILTFNLAVTGTKNEQVFMPIESSPYNRLIKDNSNNSELTKVDCITLEEIFSINKLRKVDLIKIDCEGCEYEIIFSTSKEIWSIIDRIRMENHDRKRIEELENYFNALGFSKIFERELILFFERV